MIIELTKERKDYIEQAAEILYTTFMEKGIDEWPDMTSALKELDECLQPGRTVLAFIAGDRMVGWVGARPMYEEYTWELHPLVVSSDYQGKGYGRKLLDAIEQQVAALGGMNIILGTDDVLNSTSLSDLDMEKDSLPEAMRDITSTKKHPYLFYQKCGYRIVGVIPNASGVGKPDIWMWKCVAKAR